jgi:hypothetical protein
VPGICPGLLDKLPSLSERTEASPVHAFSVDHDVDREPNAASAALGRDAGFSDFLPNGELP